MNNQVFRKLSYGLFILTARDGDRDNGCIINTAMQVSDNPSRVVIAVNKNNFTHDMIMKTGVFNVSILSEGAVFDTFKHYGFQSGKTVDKMAGITFSRSANGVAYIADEGTNGFISGKVLQTIDSGSHTLFLAEVTDGAVLSDKASATYAYYFAHIKPQPKPAEEKKKGWVCVICGYIYEGEELPADFICPVCKHPASDFRKL